MGLLEDCRPVRKEGPVIEVKKVRKEGGLACQ
jgi:hypothetical protein